MRSFLRGLWTGLGLIALVTVSVEAQSRLIFPRLSGDPGTITGVAVVNPGSLSASLAIIAFGKNGAQLGTRDELAVEASSQLSLLTSELFPGLAPETVGWIEVISPADDLTGFFLFLDPQFLMIDGADLPQAASEIVFNQLRTDSGFATELNIVNPEESEASLQLQLVGAESGLLSRDLTLAPKGVCRLDVRDFFGDSAALLADEAYVKVVAPTPVAGFQPDLR